MIKPTMFCLGLIIFVSVISSEKKYSHCNSYRGRQLPDASVTNEPPRKKIRYASEGPVELKASPSEQQKPQHSEGSERGDSKK